MVFNPRDVEAIAEADRVHAAACEQLFTMLGVPPALLADPSLPR